MLRVVHITENPIAGAPINLSKALNKYQGDKILSRHIAQSDRNEARVFDRDLLVDTTPYEQIRSLLEGADVIHLHNFYRNQHLFRKHPDLWDIVLRKKRVWQAHTQRDISWMSMEDGLRDKGARHLVIAQYHPRMYPECAVVPNVIDILDPEFMPAARPHVKVPRVVYSPSRIRFKGWDNKGYDETVPVLQKLVDERLITAEVIHNRPFRECLARRRSANISIDEIVTGSYHLVSLESLSAGLATIAGLDDKQVAVLCSLTGSTAADLPWVIARPESLEGRLRELAADAGLLDRTARGSRAWMEKYWHPRDMTQKFVDIYNGL